MYPPPTSSRDVLGAVGHHLGPRSTLHIYELVAQSDQLRLSGRNRPSRHHHRGDPFGTEHGRLRGVTQYDLLSLTRKALAGVLTMLAQLIPLR